MSSRDGNEDRGVAGRDRERQREVSNETGRVTHGARSPQAGAQGGGGSGGASARSRSARGFASMDQGKQREIASKGGRAAHAKGTAHEFDSGEAREAGRKGGVAVSRNREHMAMIGRRGGEARGRARAAQQSAPSAQSHNAQPAHGATSDRQVDIPGHSGLANGAAAASSATAATTGASSLGGESRNNTAGAAEQNPNH